MSIFKKLGSMVAVAVVVLNVAVFAQTPDINWFANNPDAATFNIANADQLAGLAGLVNNAMGLGQPVDFKGKTIVLTDNIDLSRYGAQYNEGKGWIPIGVNHYSFSGIFDGGGKNISGLYMNNSSNLRLPNVGLFGRIRDGEVKNLNVVNVNISMKTNGFLDSEGIGSIVGNLSGNISGCSSSGEINVERFDNVGGIVGRLTNGSLTRCHSAVTIKASTSNVGGLIGSAGRMLRVSECYSTGAIIGGSRSSDIGGVVGHGGNVTSCYSTGAISGGSNVGGIVGSRGTVSSSYATGNISGTGENVGGVVGSSGHITNSYSTGEISGGNNVGGILGGSYGSIINSYATGNVNGTGDNVGGAVGLLNGALDTEGEMIVNGSVSGVMYSYAFGTVTGKNNVGGVAGSNSVHIVGCYSLGTVNGANNVGGVVGVNDWQGSGMGNFSVENNVALNPSVRSTGADFGRVAGFSKDRFGEEKYLSNNVVFSGLTNATGNVLWLGKSANGRNGADITKEEISADGTLGGRFTAANGWTIENGKLPGLGGRAVDLPAHLR